MLFLKKIQNISRKNLLKWANLTGTFPQVIGRFHESYHFKKWIPFFMTTFLVMHPLAKWFTFWNKNKSLCNINLTVSKKLSLLSSVLNLVLRKRLVFFGINVLKRLSVFLIHTSCLLPYISFIIWENFEVYFMNLWFMVCLKTYFI